MAGPQENKETQAMKCSVCGGELETLKTDLPFKINEETIIIVKGLPVYQCSRCPEYLIDDHVLQRVDEILGKVEGSTELEIVRFAA
jgi:YgiT-type zinc finger domain-containing protein